MNDNRTAQIERATREYLQPGNFGRPRRKLVQMNKEYGLVCIECRQAKPLSEFGFSQQKKGYFESMCRSCKSEYHRNRKKK